jgi:hypothetical protein
MKREEAKLCVRRILAVFPGKRQNIGDTALNCVSLFSAARADVLMFYPISPASAPSMRFVRRDTSR